MKNHRIKGNPLRKEFYQLYSYWREVEREYQHQPSRNPSIAYQVFLQLGYIPRGVSRTKVHIENNVNFWGSVVGPAGKLP